MRRLDSSHSSKTRWATRPSLPGMTTVFPTLKYDDAHAAIEFLTTALGFEKHAVHETDDGKVAHAELRHGDGMVMLGDRAVGEQVYAPGRVVTYIAIEDPDALHERAK